MLIFLWNDPVVLSDHWVGCWVSYKLPSVCIAEPLGINFIGATMKLFSLQRPILCVCAMASFKTGTAWCAYIVCASVGSYFLCIQSSYSSLCHLLYQNGWDADNSSTVVAWKWFERYAVVDFRESSS